MSARAKWRNSTAFFGESGSASSTRCGEMCGVNKWSILIDTIYRCSVVYLLLDRLRKVSRMWRNGRRAALRTLWEQSRGGSSPLIRTNHRTEQSSTESDSRSNGGD